MVVTRSSKEEQSVKDESQATEGGAEEGGAVGGQEEVKETIDQSEMLNVLLKTVEKMSKTLVNHAEQGAQLTAQMAKMSTVFGQQSSGSGVFLLELLSCRLLMASLLKAIRCQHCHKHPNISLNLRYMIVQFRG